MKQLDHHQALSKAKIQLMARPDSAFFTTVAFSLKHVFDDKVGTACTDGKSVVYSPKFFLSLSTEEQVFLLLHESMHVAYMHMGRLGGRDPNRWNRAADYVINLQLHERGFKMPACGLLDPQYAGMSTEQVYELLSKQDTPGPPLPMEDLVYGDGSVQSQEQLERDVQDILVRARIQSKMANDKPGSIPGDIEIYLDNLLNPKLPWNRLLQRYLKSFDKSDYSFKKPNRRFFPKHHMPSLWGESLCDLAIAVDTSGSVSDHDFNVFVSEVASILRMMKPERISLIQFDTQIKSVDEIRSVNELMRCKFTGRGGTLINPVLEWANQKRPQVLLIFSDGGFHFYDTQTKSDTLWLIHNNERFTAPFGKVIHYSI